VLATLKMSPSASFDTVLGNWRYHAPRNVDEAETARVGEILDDERAAMIKREFTDKGRSWWRFW
jgi:hypothetical protein